MRPRALVCAATAVILTAALFVCFRTESANKPAIGNTDTSPSGRVEGADPEGSASNPVEVETAPPGTTRTSVRASLKVIVTKEGIAVEDAIVRALQVTPDLMTYRTSSAALPDALIRSATSVTTRPDGVTSIETTPGTSVFVAAWAEGSAPMGLLVDPLTEQVEISLAPAQKIEGVVVDREGRPIPNATITAVRALFLEERFYPDLSGPGERLAARFFPRSAQSDADGSYVVTGLPMAMVEVWVSKAGYSSVGTEELWPPDSAWFKAVLTAGEGRVSGVIRDAATQRPLPGAKVWVSAMTTPGLANPIATTSADQHGEFNLPGIPPDQQPALVCWMDDYRTAVIDLSGLRKGEHRRLSLDLNLGSVMRGRVEDPTGEPIPLAVIQANVGPLSVPVECVSSTDDGSFEIPGLDPTERYTLNCTAWRFTQLILNDVSGGDQDVLVALAPTSTMGGRVLVEGSPAITGKVRITASNSSGGLEVSRYADILESGRFQFETVDRRPHRLDVFVPGRAPTSIERVDVISEITDLGDIETLLGPDLRGRVTDDTGRPVSGARVSLAGLMADSVGVNATLPVESVSTADGAFDLGPVVPGLVGIIVDHPDYAISTRAVRIPIGASSWDIDVAVVAAGAIEIRMLDQRGAPIATFQGGTFATADSMKRQDHSLNGALLIDRLPIGVREAWAFVDTAQGSHLAGQQFVERVTVRPGETSHITFETAKGLVIDGIVRPAVDKRRMTACADLVDSDDGFVRTCVLRADGSFRLSSLRPGTYRLYVETTDDGPRIYASTIVTLPRVDERPLEIVLGVGEVRGTVTAGNRPVEEVHVFILPSDSDDRKIATQAAVRSASDGTFTRIGLPPGRYWWVTKKDGFATENGELTVRPGAAYTDLAIELFPEAELLVRVHDRDENPITPDACYTHPLARDVNGAQWKAGLALVGDARRIGRLPSGSHELVVRAAGFFPHFETVEIAAGASRSIDVVLRRGGILDLTIVDAAGAVMPGVACVLRDDTTGDNVSDWLSAGLISSTSPSGLISNDAGSCQLTGLPEGTYTLTHGDLSWEFEMTAQEQPVRILIEI